MSQTAILIGPFVVLATVVVLMVVAGLGFAISLLRGKRSVPKAGVSLVTVVWGTLLLLIPVLGIGGMLVFVGFSHAERVKAAPSDPQLPYESVSSDPLVYQPSRIPVESRAERLPLEAARPGLGVETLPEWVRNGGKDFRVIRGSQQATPTGARRAAMADAVRAVRERFRDWQDGLPGLEVVPDQRDIERLAVKNTYPEEIERSTDKHDFLMYRSYVQVDVSAAVMEELEKATREKARDLRAVQVAVWFGVLASIAGLVSLFFRIDESLRGRYRALLVAGTVGSAVLLLALPVMGEAHLREISKDWLGRTNEVPGEVVEKMPPHPRKITLPVDPEGFQGPHRWLAETSCEWSFDFDD